MNRQKVDSARTALCSILILSGAACASGSIDDEKSTDGSGSFSSAVVDARLVADVSTWSCVDANTGEMYQGAFGQEVTLEHAPGGVGALDLPNPGSCVAGLNMFPDDAGSGATDIPGIAFDPVWESDVDDGTLGKKSIGFYYDDVYTDERTCYSTDEVMAGGVTLVDAGPLTGAATPPPNAAPTVDFGSPGAAIEFGDTVSLEWGTHLWDEVFVQVRREKEGDAWESVTCNVTGENGFVVDAAVWDLMDERIQVDRNALYVGFQTSERTSLSGMEVQVVTRAIAQDR